MIDVINPALETIAAAPRKILKMVKNERMGGSVPMWVDAPEKPQEKIEQNLSVAQTEKSAESFDSILAYQQQSQNPDSRVEEFSFGDLLDMINPLQHIPIVNYVYREITNDQIKPIGQIIGGAVFGGGAGAAVGLASAIVEEETGKNISENTIALVMKGETPSLKSSTGKHEQQLEKAIQLAKNNETNDLPASLLAFTDNGYKSGIKIEKVDLAESRTAGTITQKFYPKISETALPPREPITEVIFNKQRRYNG